MGVTEDLADDLATHTIKYIEASGDEDIIADLVKVLGATSQTAEEAFLTSIRVRRANKKANELLVERVKAFKAKHGGTDKTPES
ncbi:hypothetical protein [Roseovarius aestuarii]|uniref:Uncharacterized protein n=1 Tax=Roseovarius aestuarii TaxID=475083 RepID=A0A1X7BUD8_9RHOB|nr:hypothetical protein [Roseovarius aestuarii]SMC13301.1 hypothetical protein ROA7745_03147 [Roseovarius aestuarii]